MTSFSIIFFEVQRNQVDVAHAWTRGPLKRANKHATVHSWFILPTRESGIGVSNKWFSFIRLFILSICILNFATSSVCSILLIVNCLLLLRNSGMLSVTPLSANIFRSVNPLSAITSSPGSRRSRSPHNLVISISDMHPVYKDEINVIAPCGAIPIKHLNVFVPL